MFDTIHKYTHKRPLIYYIANACKQPQISTVDAENVRSEIMQIIQESIQDLFKLKSQLTEFKIIIRWMVSRFVYKMTKHVLY